MKQRYTKRNERGITLTSLIITVILLLILAAVGIGTMSADGLFGHASYATFAQNMRNYEEKVGVYVIKEQEKQNYRYDINIYDKATMKEIVSDFTDEQAEQYVIQDNELKYRADKVDSTEREC